MGHPALVHGSPMGHLCISAGPWVTDDPSFITHGFAMALRRVTHGFP